MTLSCARAGVRALICGVLVLAPEGAEAAQARQNSNPPIDVPRATTPVVIDGRLESAEWARAATHTLPDGSVLRFQHDGGYLFLGLAAARSGFPSLCLARGDTVRVLHASAALGSVSYTRAGEAWVTSDTAFVYGMRNPDSTAQARQERAAYLTRHGWVATTFRMSGGLAHEMQIRIDKPVPAVALGYFVSLPNSTWSIEAWPLPGEPEGCAHPELVRGSVPRRLGFRPAAWVALHFQE